jgi:hypothetical protein
MAFKHPFHGKFVRQGQGEPGVPNYEFTVPLVDDTAKEYTSLDFAVWSEHYLGLHHWAQPEIPIMTASLVQHYAEGFQRPMPPTFFHTTPLIIPPNAGTTSTGPLTADPETQATNLQTIFAMDNTITP